MRANREPKVETRQRTPVRINFENEPVLTEQHHKQECDLKCIMRKYDAMGVDIRMFEANENDYMDIIGAPDYLEAMNQIAEANSLFDSLPARIRQSFGNRPTEFIEFMQNPENKTKITELGLNASHLPDFTESPTTNEKIKPKQTHQQGEKTAQKATQEE
ncbi:internal scaffolding protein [Microviridae sp.]|nr:internal scaffolding protein [Microviridae sp.]